MSTRASYAAERAERERVRARLAEQFPGVTFADVDTGIPSILCPPGRLVEVASFLKAAPDLSFDYLASVTAIDWLDRFEVVYQMRSLARQADLTIRAEVERDEPNLPSVTGVWRAADFQEREIYDLMGITFDGHPNLTRILLYDEFDGHPLRKDWQLPAEPRGLSAT